MLMAGMADSPAPSKKSIVDINTIPLLVANESDNNRNGMDGGYASSLKEMEPRGVEPLTSTMRM